MSYDTQTMIGDINHFNLDLSGYGDTTVIVNVPSDATVFDSVLRTTGSLNIELTRSSSESTII